MVLGCHYLRGKNTVWIKTSVDHVLLVLWASNVFTFLQLLDNTQRTPSVQQSVGCEEGQVICDLCQESLQKCFLFYTSQCPMPVGKGILLSLKVKMVVHTVKLFHAIVSII